MKIQSLSIVSPTKGCVNNCPCCVSKFDMYENDYPNLIQGWVTPEEQKKNIKVKENQNYKGYFDWTNEKDYIKRMQFARDNGCNIMLITASSGEALQNKQFLEKLASWNKKLRKPFLWIEFQTTGIMLTDENLKFLKETLSVTTIALSVFDIHDNKINDNIIDIKEKLRFNLIDLCLKIKEMNFNLRLSINMTDITSEYFPNVHFSMAKILGADQLTFRKLYTPNKVELYHPRIKEIKETIQWIKDHPIDKEYINKLNHWIREYGKELEPLDFGPVRYSVDGISTVLDDNCMIQNGQQNAVLRYLILRENCKLYSRWDDPGSKVF